MLQFLLLNGAKINNKDSTGKTALLLATELGKKQENCLKNTSQFIIGIAYQLGLPAQVGLLLKNRADQKIPDLDGNTPLDVAVKTANADIVSL